jgi:tetratricopeptide (TPR) repeat protein
MEEMFELLIAIGHYARVQRRFDDARYLFERLARLSPAQASPHLGLGLVEVDRANYGKAVLLCRRAVDMQPDYALARAWLGACLLFEEKYASGARMLMSVSNSDDPAACRTAMAFLDLPQCAPYRSAYRETAATSRSVPILYQLTIRESQ